MNIHDIRGQFEPFRNEKNAIWMKKYLKNKFEFFGIKSPARKDISKGIHRELRTATLDDVLLVVKKLWQEPERELHYLGMEMLDKKKKQLTEKHLEFCEWLVLKNSWWDSVDYLSTHAFSPIIYNLTEQHQKNYVKYLANHSDMWLNRVGIIFQLMWKDQTNIELLEIAIEPHTESTEFFHRKAIGWALRQYSKYNPEYVRVYLANHELSGLTVREASKYL